MLTRPAEMHDGTCPVWGPIFRALDPSDARVEVRSLWHATLPLKPPFHALMSDIDRIAEHERAATDDGVDAVRIALSDGLL